MGSDEVQQAELLEAYCHQLEQNPTATPPAGLDPELAEQAQLLRRGLDAPAPTLAYSTRLKAQLESTLRGATSGEAPSFTPMLPDIGASRLSRPTPPIRHWLFPRLATAAVAVLIVAIGWFLLGNLNSNSTPLSAAQILQRAQAVFTNGSIKSVAISETTTSRITSSIPALSNSPTPIPSAPVVATATDQVALWYQAPNLWHTEYSRQVKDPLIADMTESISYKDVEVSDGANVWHYSDYNLGTVDDKKVDVRLLTSLSDISSGVQPLTHAGKDQLAIIQAIIRCDNPILVGSQVIDGRIAYVLDSGSTSCQLYTKYTIWIDQSTYFVLKIETNGGQAANETIISSTLTVRFNQPIDTGVFSFTPPTGVLVSDYRPTILTASQFDAQMQTLAAHARYTLFVPGYVPAGLVPRQPQVDGTDPSAGDLILSLNYVSATEVTQVVDPVKHGLVIRQSGWSLQDDDIKKDKQGGLPRTYIDGYSAWIEYTVYGNQAYPGVSLTINKGGNTIQLMSASLSEDELIKVARSLKQVPTGGIATPTPTSSQKTISNSANDLAFRRRGAKFRIFVLLETPAGLTIKPLVAIDFLINGGKPLVEITYAHPDGSFALSILSGAKGCCRDADPSQQGEVVTLADGTAAHFLNNPPEQGGPTLWLIKQNSYVEVRGWQMSKEQLVALANTLSSTANPYGPSVFDTPAP